jgi:hypothetical protein
MSKMKKEKARKAQRRQLALNVVVLVDANQHSDFESSQLGLFNFLVRPTAYTR